MNELYLFKYECYGTYILGRKMKELYLFKYECYGTCILGPMGWEIS